MADIEMREERLRIQAQLMSDKQAKRRTQQMSGFQVTFLKKNVTHKFKKYVNWLTYRNNI